MVLGTTPRQISIHHYNIVRKFGQIGFFTKAFIYATIGGLTLESSSTDAIHNESPQGVFILLGSVPNGAGHVLLVLMLTGVTIYCVWRFWEGLTGQGYDPSFSKKKNFFKYRISPLVSGLVYSIYGAYIIYLFTIEPSPPGVSSLQNEDQSCFPVCWNENTAGKIGLGMLAFIFTIATITQLVPTLTGNFRNEIDFNKLNTKVGKLIRYPFLIAGHLGHFGRAVLFFLVSFLFWKILLGDIIFLDPKQSTIAQAINSLRENVIGTVIMAILGICLIMYGIYALICIYLKIFPTPPPSTNFSLP